MTNLPEGFKLIGEIGTIALKPDDVIIVKTERPVGWGAADNIRSLLSGVFPDHMILVLDSGITLEVARKETA